MARIALLSDVHGNLDALRSALEDVSRVGADVVVCLGDVVGYGPEPGECVDLVRESCDVVVRGNHDEAALSRKGLGRFNAGARASAEFAYARLSAAQKRVMLSWGARAEVMGLWVTHASFGKHEMEYVTTNGSAARSFGGVDAGLMAVGHTHIPSAFTCPEGEVREGEVRGYPLPSGPTIALPSDRRVLVNPGSVGQPRDGNPEASWMLLDTGMRTAQVRRVAYDVEGVREKIRAAGLPDGLGERLLVGA
ncbi:MAG: metallophosphoesterase [Phycisphaerales bacterium]